MKRGFRCVAVVSMLLVALAACGGGNKVGSAFKDFKGEKGGSRIGDVEATATPKPKTSAAPVRTQAPAAPQATAAKPSSLTVKITTAGFDPTSARVFQGSTVTVTNTDGPAHSYTSSDGTYDTGSLGGGQSKTFTAGTPGSFQMVDRTRNWIVGSLEVVAR